MYYFVTSIVISLQVRGSLNLFFFVFFNSLCSKKKEKGMSYIANIRDATCIVLLLSYCIMLKCNQELSIDMYIYIRVYKIK